MGYLHAEVKTAQTAHRPGAPCGDVVRTWTGERGMIAILCDGIRSGTRARIAGDMAAERLLTFLKNGDSLRRSAARMRRTMEICREPGQPFAAFLAAIVRPDGICTIVGYDIPPPCYISGTRLTVLEPVAVSEPRLAEYRIRLEPGECILLLSDGITESGRGQPGLRAWGMDGVKEFANDALTAREPLDHLPNELVRESVFRDREGHDDCTAVLLSTRAGKELHILTGPPLRRDDDAMVVKKFLARKGEKIICGGTTAGIFARETGQDAAAVPETPNRMTPPGTALAGVDLVTEGVVTLNQAYNLFEEDLEFWEEDNRAVALCRLLQSADRIHLLVGRAQNKNNLTAASRQMGIISRCEILELFARKMRAAGKVVMTEQF